MTMEYEDMVRAITRTYWKALLDQDGPAREQAAALMHRYGLNPDAADKIIEEFSRKPLQEWLAPQSDAQASAPLTSTRQAATKEA